MVFATRLRQKVSDLENQLKQQQKSVAEFARVYFLMANECEVKFKDTRSALANLNKALKLNPNFREALIRRGILLCQTGDLKSAEADFSRLLKLKHRNFNALMERGKVRLQLRKFPGALQDFLEAANLQKSNPEVYKHLGDVYAKLGEMEKARNFWNMAIGLTDED
jgi:tetratricopeptide (TPR) repeat protein